MIGQRQCPQCGQATISVLKLMLWRVRCTQCGAQVGTQPAWRIPLLSVELTVWMLVMSWWYPAYGRSGLVASLALWAIIDFVADCYVPLVARRRPS